MSGITETCPWVTPWKEDPVTGGKVYAGCSNVWSATGTSFTKTSGNVAGSSTVAITAIAQSPANNQIIWAGKGGILYKSTNNGASWSAMTSLPSAYISDIVCHNTDANKAWVTFSGFSNQYKVFQTTNGGTSWTNLSASIPNIPVNAITIDKNGNDALYIGTDNGVFFKDATMTVWQPFSTGMPNVVVSQLQIFYGSPNKVRASTYGRGVWESTLYVPGAYAPTANFDSDKKIGCAGMAVQFSDYSPGSPTSWSWTFPGGNPASSTLQNPLVYYNTPGTYAVTLTVTNAVGNDTETKNSFITISTSPYAAPTAPGVNFCAPASVTLNATPSAPGTVRWWNLPGGGTLLGTGNSYTTPVLSNTTTYYVDEAFPNGATDYVGEFCYNFGTGAMFTANDIRGLYFDVTQPAILQRVDVFCNSAGNRTVEIIDPQGNWYKDTTMNVPAAPTSGYTMNLNFTMYPGTGYFIKFRGLVDCYRNNSGAVYPYLSASGGPITITNSNAGTPGYYYFFYNWEYTQIVCNTSRTAVTATNTCPIGVNDLFSSGYIGVFPNPSNGEFSVFFNTDNADNYAVKINNALGQTVYEEALNNFSGVYEKQLDIGSWGKGVYMLSVTNSKNEVVKRVVVY